MWLIVTTQKWHTNGWMLQVLSLFGMHHQTNTTLFQFTCVFLVNQFKLALFLCCICVYTYTFMFMCMYWCLFICFICIFQNNHMLSFSRIKSCFVFQLMDIPLVFYLYFDVSKPKLRQWCLNCKFYLRWLYICFSFFN